MRYKAGRELRAGPPTHATERSRERRQVQGQGASRFSSTNQDGECRRGPPPTVQSARDEEKSNFLGYREWGIGGCLGK